MRILAAHRPTRGWALVAVTSYLLLLVLSLVIPTGHVAAAGAFVQQSPVSITTSNANSITATLPVGATAGNLIVVICSAGTATTLSVTGYSVAAAPVSGTVSQGIFYKIAAGGETGVTCSSTVRTKAGLGAHVYEYSGMNVVGTIDVSGTASGTGTAVNSGSATPTSTSSLVFTAFTAAGGASFSGLTAGYTKRADTLNTIHVAQADLFTTANTAQSASATNAASVAWRGQVAVFKVAVGVKTADIVDAAGSPVSNPAIAFPAAILDLDCNVNGATLGTSNQKIRINNTTPSPTWSITIAATSGGTATWSKGGGGGNNNYDFNDPSVDGCTDGGDSDSFAGKMEINPGTGTITPIGGGCTNTGISLGSQTGFSEGTQDSITLVAAGSGAQTGCMWDITGITLIQRIPADQSTGTYSISFTLTLLAS